MSVTLLPLFEPVQIASSITTYLPAVGVRTRIDQMTLVNSDSAATHYATIYWVPSGMTAGPANAILFGGSPGKILQPYEVYVVSGFVGHVLGIGDFIAAVADAANKITFFASGTQVS